MEFLFIQIWGYNFKLLYRVKSTQDGKVHFFRGNDLKLTLVELLSLFYFKNSIFMFWHKISTFHRSKSRNHLRKSDFAAILQFNGYTKKVSDFFSFTTQCAGIFYYYRYNTTRNPLRLRMVAFYGKNYRYFTD